MNKGQLRDNMPLNVLVLAEVADEMDEWTKTYFTLKRYEEDGNYNVRYATAHIIDTDDPDDIYGRLVQLSGWISSNFDLVVGYGYGGAITIALQKFCAVPYITINPVFNNVALKNQTYKKNFQIILSDYLDWQDDLDESTESNCLLISKYGREDVRPTIAHYSKNPVKEVISVMQRKREQLIYDTVMDMLYKIRIKKTVFFE